MNASPYSAISENYVPQTFLQQFLKDTFLFQLNDDVCAQSEVHEIEMV